MYIAVRCLRSARNLTSALGSFGGYSQKRYKVSHLESEYHCDCAIIGGGAIGSSIAYHLKTMKGLLRVGNLNLLSPEFSNFEEVSFLKFSISCAPLEGMHIMFSQEQL